MTRRQNHATALTSALVNIEVADGAVIIALLSGGEAYIRHYSGFAERLVHCAWCSNASVYFNTFVVVVTCSSLCFFFYKRRYTYSDAVAVFIARFS